MKTVQNLIGNKNWVTHPTTLTLWIIGIVWLIGNGLLVAAVTDFFAAGFLNKKYLLIYMMMLISTWSTVHIFLNYFRRREA